MKSWINLGILFLLFQLLNYSLKAQDFGCFTAESNNDLFYRQTLLYNREYKTIYNDLFSNYVISSTTDGYCVERFCPYEKIASKVKMKGNIINGKADGKWFFYDGLSDYCFSGNFVDGKKEGIWKSYNLLGHDTIVLFQVTFINDSLNGLYVEYYKGVVLRSVEYENGSINGLDVIRYEDGCVKNIVEYKNGLKNGVELYLDNNGDTISCVRFKNDTLHGKSVSLNNSIEYKNGKADGNLKIGEEVINFDDGTLKRRGNYVIINKEGKDKSVPHGLFKYYYKNGIIRAEENFELGEYKGKSSYYDDAGNLIRIYFVAENGSSYNIFEGDTVNRIDSLGQKQGKWIKLREKECSKEIVTTTYFKNNKPISESVRYSRFCSSRCTKKWETEDLVKEILYNDSTIIEEGYVYQNQRVGEWKEYDFQKGYLIARGLYFSGKKMGKWYYYNRLGKVVYVREFHTNGTSDVIKIKNKRKFKAPEKLEF